jgi:two-component system, NtrC family, response regulator AtoC
MRKLFAQILGVALHFGTVLVTGESGTGKELVAQALHGLSPASAGPYVVVNCSAVAEHFLKANYSDT